MKVGSQSWLRMGERLADQMEEADAEEREGEEDWER